MSEAATLMFGLGVTRAGSTWLYRYLAGHPDCALPRVKELHYFSTMDFGGAERQVNRLSRLSKRAAKQYDRADAKGDADKKASVVDWQRDIADLSDLVSRDEDSAAYLSYLTQHRGGQLHGDITPAYALLSEERLSMMAGLSPRSRFVMFLRDPVSRLWSNVLQSARLKALRREDDPPTEMIAQIAKNMFNQWTKGNAEPLAVRCDYEGMLTRLGRAVPGERVFVDFYERLFRDETIAKLCAFLGISDHKANFEHRSNVSDRIDMTDAQRDIARARLAPQYDFIDSYMGGDLPKRWMQNRPAVAGEVRV